MIEMTVEVNSQYGVVLVGNVFGAVDEGEDDVPEGQERQTLTGRGTLPGFI